jgi:chemotaxis protein MotB
MGGGMARQGNAAPVVIKRKKVISGGGHHGGAWKVAYADFVTAMMAFFLLMWLLNATTEKQRKGIADFFSPTIPVNRVSGGGDGAFGGDSMLTEETLARNGTGASAKDHMQTTRSQAEGGSTSEEVAAEEAILRDVERQLSAYTGESMVSDRLLRHVVTRLSDEGLVIELFDTQEETLFDPETANARPILRDLAALLVDVTALATNKLAISGHVRAYPITLRTDPTWDLSTTRAQTLRGLLGEAGLDAARMQRITGFADRRPATADPTNSRNNRVEVTLLRRQSAIGSF